MSKLIDVRANVHIFEDNHFDFSDIIDLYFNINNTILHFYCSYDGETMCRTKKESDGICKLLYEFHRFKF